MNEIKKLDLSAEGLTGYIVTYSVPGDPTGQEMHFWAEDVAHAGEQMEDAVPDCSIGLIETETEYEARTGRTMYDCTPGTLVIY